MTERGIENCFSMAAFLAFVELYSFRATHPTLSLADILASVKKLKANATGLDFSAGLTLLERLDASVTWHPSKEGLRQFVYNWVRLVEPTWLRFVPYGRNKLRRTLSDDEVQCFREAGLFDAKPDDDALQWWDKITALMRSASDTEKMEQARFAERLSLQYEQNRLEGLGIVLQPEWVSLEDNSLGYDILSYDLDAGLIVNRLVEVKSTLSDSIFLTRTEWENAVGSPQRTVFHVWSLPAEELREYKVAEIASDIPSDQGAGRWLEVRIPLET